MSDNMTLLEQHCVDIPKGSKPMIIPSIESHLMQVEGWETPLSYQHIDRTFKFKNYHQTVSFVNAVTWLAHKEDHHPEICFSYNECKIILKTHSVEGVSLNDFIVAAKINQLLA